MIEYIHKKLEQWAEWRCKSDVGAIGYASCVLSLELRTPGNSSFSGIPCDVTESMYELEMCVAELDIEKQRFVEQVYFHAGTDLSHMRVLGIAKKTFYRRLDTIHNQLNDYLTNPGRRRRDTHMRLFAIHALDRVTPK